ncbi:hypothetical protein [Actinoplanes sp. G11-F43]|uniref:Rv0361 family membrane protein n=1 Tax=Actinoplanes sp. G11-F43 TaxID=3424130 RepID=UPI003D32B93C
MPQSFKWWIAGGVTAFLLVVAGVVWAVSSGGDGPAEVTEEDRIRDLISEFALAVDREDQASILRLLCAEEADEIRAGADFDPTLDGDVDVAVSAAPVSVTDLQITGDTARAGITRPAREPATLAFRKENGTWTVCAPAAGSVPSPYSSR